MTSPYSAQPPAWPASGAFGVPQSEARGPKEAMGAPRAGTPGQAELVPMHGPGRGAQHQPAESGAPGAAGNGSEGAGSPIPGTGPIPAPGTAPGPSLAPGQDPERGGPDLPVLPAGWPLVARTDPPAPGEARPRDVIDGTGPRRGPEDVAPDRGSPGAARGGPQAPGGGGGGGDSAVAAFAMLDALFVRAPVGLALLDRTGRSVRVNEALTRLDRRSARDHLGRTASEVLGDSDSELDALLARVLCTGEAVVDLEVGVAGPAGTPLTWLASWFPVTDPQLGPVGVSFVALDVTGR